MIIVVTVDVNIKGLLNYTSSTNKEAIKKDLSIK